MKLGGGVMKYMGSKNRIAKEILPYMLEGRKDGQWWVEPFVGGCNMIDKVDGNRIGSDSNEYLIETMIALRDGWNQPKELTERQYSDIKSNKDNYEKCLVGFVGFACSYAAKWFGGYCRGFSNDGKPRDYIMEAWRNVEKQKPKLKGIILKHSKFDELDIPEGSIIYCDPPYQKTTKYKDNFNHSKFWQWCRDKHREGHKVFVSEYSAPQDFDCIWKKEITSSLTKDTGGKTGVEKLFIFNPHQP